MATPEPCRAALFGVAVALAACSAEAPPTSKPWSRATGAPLSADRWQLCGGGVCEGAAVPLEDVLAAPASFAGKDLRVTGAVRAVCKVEGRWLTLGDAAANVRVTCNGFSVPTDCEGREAIVEGRLRTSEEVPPRDVYVFVADGVALQRTAAK